MKTARRSDGLLPSNDTIKLIELLEAKQAPTEGEKLLRELAAIKPISWTRARNTITKLSNYGLFQKVGASEFEIGKCEYSSWLEAIAGKVAVELTYILSASNSWSCMRLDVGTGALKIDSLLLPAMNDGLGMWITDFGIAARASISDRLWAVAPRYESRFLKGVGKANKHPRRAKSAEKLASELEMKARLGEAAEEWVLEYERQRLSGHPLQGQIRRVSIDDVAAGYDIVSFASPASLQHDLFIEVKSHGATKLFHWSRNEIAVAREFGESYALYLIDRHLCDAPNYEPHVILGPTPEMFSAKGSGWTVEATSFEHIALPDE